MTTYTAAQLEAFLLNFVDNIENKLDQIINGDSSSTVTVDSGTVSTIAKLFNDMTASLTTASYEFTGSAAQTDLVCTGANIPGVNSVIVIIDGIQQRPSDYTITTTSTSNDTVQLGSALSGGEELEVRLLAAPQSIGTGDATNINYAQGSTGYSSRSVEEKFQAESLSLLDFGADPTGATSSAGALSSAMDAAMTLGLPLRIPAGTYTLSAWTTKTTTAGLHIFGDPGAVLTYTGGVSTAYFVEPDHSLTLEGLEFSGFPRIISQGTHGGTRVDRINMVGCKVLDCDNYAVYLRTPFETCHICDNIFDGTGTAHNSASYIQIGVGGSGTEGDYRNLMFRRNVLENFDLEFAGTQRLVDLMVEKSSVEHNLIRNTARTANTNQVELLRVVGNQNKISDNIIDGFTNTSSATVVKGILIQGQDRTGSLPSAPSSASTCLFGHSNRVASNRIKDLVAVDTCYGIQVGTEDTIVESNVVDNIATTGGGSTANGILYSTSTATDNCIIRGNIVTGSPRDGIYVDTDGHAIISNNAVLGFKRYGLYLNCDLGGAFVSTCSGNTPNDNGVTTESPSAAIRMQRGNWSCTGNACKGTNMDYGIYVASSTADCVVSGNHVDGGATAPIQTASGADPHLVQGNSVVSGSIVNDNGSQVYGNLVGGAIDSSPGVAAACYFTVGASSATLQSGSFNVTSVTHNNAADEFTIAFTNTLPNADYVVSITESIGTVSRSIDELCTIKSRGTNSLVIGYDNSNYPLSVNVVVHQF